MPKQKRWRRRAQDVDILAALDRLGADLAALRQIVVGEAPARPAPAEPVALVDDDRPEWVSLAKAAAACGVHVDTMSTRCRAHGLGHRPGGRDYRVDMVRVRKWEQGQPYTRLSAAIPEGSGKPRKVPDASRGRRAAD